MTASESKHEQIQRLTESLFARDPDWVTFYREVLGLHGVVRRNYTTRESLAEFEQTETYLEIQQMLSRLRGKRPPANDPGEATKVVTVRLPKSLHEALRVEAHEHHTSMNKLCISKLLQFIDGQMIPAEP